MAFRHVRKRALGLVAVVLALLATIVAQPSPAAAIPNTSILPHEHSPATITFPTDLLGLFLASALPDSISHQHRQPISLGGNRAVMGVEDSNLGRPALYDAYAAWDDRTRREDDVGTFDLGHGYIDDRGYGFPTTVAGFRLTPFSAVRYCFSTAAADAPPGTAAQQAQFQQQVRESFTAYSQLDAPEAGLVTGLEFVEVACTTAHEVQIRWRDIDGLGNTTGNSPVIVTFDDRVGAGTAGIRGWSLNAPAGVLDSEAHFRSTALHEIGHVVGLDHDDNEAEVMIDGRRLGCKEHLPKPVGADTRGPCFATLQGQDVAGSLDLYSVPAPDFGDAPDPYPTKLTHLLVLDKGARAPGITQEWMGPAGASTTTRERTPNQTAGDAGDDGCNAQGGVLSRRADADSKVDVTVSFAGDGSRYQGADLLRVAVWIDFNDDKDWTAAERVILSSLDPANPGDWARVGQASSFRQTFEVELPDNSVPFAWMRCRLVYASGTDHLAGNQGDESLLPAADTPAYRLPGTGEDSGGEIEDHLVIIEDPDYCSTHADDEGCQDDGGGDDGDDDGDPGDEPAPDPDPDSDSDDWPDSLDNCPDDASADRSDLDDDGTGDVCDDDDDGDGIDEEGSSDDQGGDEEGGDEEGGDEEGGDEEGDDGGDVCPLAIDPDQADLDDDGTGDACDDDDDGDGADDTDEIDTGSDPDDPGSGPESDDVSGACSDGLDNDRDGLDDTDDGGCPDLDGDGTADVDDDDDDGDGTPDVDEARDDPGDPDGSGDDPDDPGDNPDNPDDPGDDPDPDDPGDDLAGVEHVLVGDSCDDGLDNDADGPVDGDDEGCIDEDGDGIPDLLDDDDDGDGLPDVIDVAEPVHPGDPVDPDDPVDPVGPEDPSEPVGPVHPVDPLRPVDGDVLARRSELTHQLG